MYEEINSEYELPGLDSADLIRLTEEQVAAVFRLAQHRLEWCEGLVKLEGRLVEEARQEVAGAANAQARSPANRRLQYLERCVERTRNRSRQEAVHKSDDGARLSKGCSN
jgi:hypothetical protein